ncbi:hypothetical protein THAOC_31797, partial [Thalassiosira oceanica]
MEIDERAFEAIDSVNQRWVDRVTKREEMDDGTMPGHGNGEKSDGALTSEEVEALLEQHTSQLKQQTRQLEERVQLLEEKNDALIGMSSHARTVPSLREARSARPLTPLPVDDPAALPPAPRPGRRLLPPGLALDLVQVAAAEHVQAGHAPQAHVPDHAGADPGHPPGLEAHLLPQLVEAPDRVGPVPQAEPLHAVELVPQEGPVGVVRELVEPRVGPGDVGPYPPEPLVVHLVAPRLVAVPDPTLEEGLAPLVTPQVQAVELPQRRPLLALAAEYDESPSGPAGAARPAESVDVSLAVLGAPELYHVGYVGVVDAPRGDVGREQHARFPVPEVARRLRPVALGLLAVYLEYRDLVQAHALCEELAHGRGREEDHDLEVGRVRGVYYVVEYVGESRDPALPLAERGEGDEGLIDFRVRLRGRVVVPEAVDRLVPVPHARDEDRPERLGNRRREQQELLLVLPPPPRVEDELDVFPEAHVHAPVGLVEDEDRVASHDLRERRPVQLAVVHVVQEPSRRGHQHERSPPFAWDDARSCAWPCICVASSLVGATMSIATPPLPAGLPSSSPPTAWPCGPGTRAGPQRVLDRREEEREGLARAGPRTAEDVPPGRGRAERQALDVRGRRQAELVLEGVEGGGVQAEVRERGRGRGRPGLGGKARVRRRRPPRRGGVADAAEPRGGGVAC